MDLENIVLGFFGFVGDLDFNFLWRALIFLLLVFWIVILGWVWIDSGERTSKTYTRVIYLLIVFFLNIPGLIIYLIIRPSETIEEIYWADLERRYLKYETAGLGDCPKCGNQLFPGYVYCSSCGHELKIKCPKCDMLIDKNDKFCSFCGFRVNVREKKDEYPTVEVMEQQILATREDAIEKVESNRVRYKSGKSLVVKLGDSILSAWNGFRTTISALSNKSLAMSREVASVTVENKSKGEIPIKNEVPKSNKKSKNRRKKKNKKK